MKSLDNFYAQHSEPIKSCLLVLREIILSQDEAITENRKYGMPFFCYKQKMFCYLWVHRKYKQPYIGLVEGYRFNHPDLMAEKRARMKIMLFDPHSDLPLQTITDILQEALNLYKTGVIKTKANASGE